MAVLERGTAYKTKPKRNLMGDIAKAGLNSAVAPLEAITGKNFYDPTMTTGFGEKAMKTTDTLGKIANAGGMAVLGAMTGGMAPKIIGGIGSAVGEALPPDQVETLPEQPVEAIAPSTTLKYGGLYYKRGKRFLKFGGEIPPTGAPVNQTLIDSNLIKASAQQPKQGMKPVTGGVRFLPNGGIEPYNSLQPPPYTPPTPEEIARVMAETQAQALVQNNPQKRMGGLIPKTMENPLNQWKDGGSLLTEYQGNTHEAGGIAISNSDEVEDKENSFNLKDGNKYIFSNSINMPDKKYTFAQGARRVANKYKLREGDAMAKTAQERELGQLSQKQEFVKQIMNPENNSMNEFIPQYKYGGNIVPSTNDGYVPMQNSYDEGGYLNTMFKGGGVKMVNPTPVDILDNSPLTSEVTFGDINSYTPQAMTKSRGVYGNAASLQRGTTPAYKQNMLMATNAANKSTNAGGYKPAYGVPMAGYAAQALSNLPALFAKPAKVNYDRITPEIIDLSSQRDEARRNRNLQLAMAQRQAGQMDNAGQAGAYSNAATSGIMGNYGDAFNQSIMGQQTANVGIRNQAKAQNAQIQMAEQNARQQEIDAVRSAKQQAAMNIGQAVALAGSTYGQMGADAAKINALSKVTPNYGYDEFLSPYRKGYKCGGKIRRKK